MSSLVGARQLFFLTMRDGWLLYGMTITNTLTAHINAGLHGDACHKARQQMSANDAAGMPAKVD
jgi:hypothetical protein